jgi:uncharacterized damage-inducible protein DinB
MKNRIDLLLAVIDDAYSGKSWQGPNLKGSIRGLSPEDASWRPGPNRHNIWELVMHVAYWKYAVKRKLLNEKRGSFPVKGGNWLVRPQELTKAAWEADRHVLDEVHQKFRKAIASLNPTVLDRPMPGSRYPYAKMIYGVAAHDIYHTGQITLIKRLIKSCSPKSFAAF